ncbi:DUF1033 family protein [Streptococcaceae bacterium ESL0687]|nr:DUF1033 family protein [Streptococcaceae bacterium ESL0687]
MYQVVKLFGDTEPWWFFDDWKKDIIEFKEFKDFYSALKFYKENLGQAVCCYEQFLSRSDFLATFWDRGEQVWCEECGDDLQQYHSLTLLEDWQPVTSYEKRWAYSKKTGCTPFKSCKRKDK